MAHKVKTRRGKRRVSEKRFASKLTRPENNRPRNEKQAPTRETAFGAALRRALERRPPTAEERDFDAEWNLRAAFAKRGQR